MIRTSLALIIGLGLFISSCNNKQNDENKDQVVVDTIHTVVHDTVKESTPKASNTKAKPAGNKKPSGTPTPAPTNYDNWRATLAEYHELLCKEHKGTSTADDKIRQAELSKQMIDISKHIPKSERFEYTAAMAHAANMESCK